jgi:hypothetical protein
MTPQTKLVFLVSDTGWNGVEDLCQAQARLAIAEPSSEEASDAYAAYTQRKRDLIEYIAGLEKAQRIPRESRVLSVFTSLLPRRNAEQQSDGWSPEKP